MRTSDRFFFDFGIWYFSLTLVFSYFGIFLWYFPVINELTIVPTGDVPSFIRSGDTISPSELYKKFSLGNAGGLVCVHFLATLNVHLQDDKIISKKQKKALIEFFHNLSMQALSKSDNAILIKFDATNKLNKSLNDLLTDEAL